MEKKMYYIISLKHTSKGDTALTFFRANNCGYAWHRKNVGIYNEEDAIRFSSEDSPKVDKELVDKFWMNALDFEDEYVSVPNNKTVLHHLGLSDKYMKPKRMASCRMTFINTPVIQ